MDPVANLRNIPALAAVARDVETKLDAWDALGNSRRLWKGDATLWTGGDEASWLGWLRIATEQTSSIASLHAFRAEVERGGFQSALLLGMGGSSLCPEVLATTFGPRAGCPRLHVLDSTDPQQVLDFESRIDPRRTLYFVASKSGTTLEPNIFKAYFFERARTVLGDEVGSHFIAITDPGSKLQAEAERDGFRHVFAGVKSIGGRYSALSNFGMVPAAAAGFDVEGLLASARAMMQACGPEVPARDNPGVALGVLLGVLARHGRDKVTFVASPAMQPLGAWLEQLLAESTGKGGAGLIPVDLEALGPPEVYGKDRVFVHVRASSDAAAVAAQDEALGALERAGHPIVRLDVGGPAALGGEFFRWEMATAVAGAVLGIHPFDQPDVEASKLETRALTTAYERSGALPEEEPFFEGEGVRLFADAPIVTALDRLVGGEKSLAGYLRVHLSRLQPGDYAALLAYVPMQPQMQAILQTARHRIRDRKRTATCLGFGPRFLHSTGQAYKGGPNTGVFLQITGEHAQDVPVPGQRYTFGVVEAAQARGDFQVLAQRERRALRVHLGADIEAGLRTLDAAVAAAVARTA